MSARTIRAPRARKQLTEETQHSLRRFVSMSLEDCTIVRRQYLSIASAVLLCLLLYAVCNAQTAPASNREAEWKSYALPTSEFVRLVDGANAVLFRVPASWKKEEGGKTTEQQTTFRFAGPHSSLLQISIEKISDGLPLPGYVAAILQQLRNLPGSADSLAVRRTEMSGLEAREIMFEMPDENGEPTRRLIWCAVSGPAAVAVVLIEPEKHTAEIEPYLRAVVQSLTISDRERFPAFEAARSAAIKESKAARIDEVQSIIASVNGLDAAERETAIAKLAVTFATVPDAPIDLFLDRRPMVRAAAIQAIARSKNRALEPFLLKALDDPELFVAERAAAAVATMPNAIALMRDETLNWMSTGLLARVWPVLDKKSQLQILSEVFAQQTITAQQTARTRSATRTEKIYSPDPSSQLGLLTLLVDVPAQDFKLPLPEILKAKTDVLTAAALQVAFARRESLPVSELFKLLSSTSAEVQRLAALNLGESATPANITQMEEFVKRPSAQPTPVTQKGESNSDKGDVARAELRIAIKKIRLRDQLATATGEQKQQLINGALADPQLADWAFSRYVRDEVQSSGLGSANSTSSQLSPLGENAFPERMTHYVAIPNPAGAFHKLGESLNSIQMDSARAQANMVLVLNGVQRQAGLVFGAPFDGSVLDYAGIRTTAPIAMGTWTAVGAPSGIASAQRKAIVLRVGDRDRFERSLSLFQENVGSFASLPEGVSIGARFLGAVPAILPMSADMMLQERPREKKESPILKYGFQGHTEISGYPVKWFSERRVSTQGIITNDVAYLVYVGDAALLTPDLGSLRDVLQRVRLGGAALNRNVQFKAALETGGDAIYFSNLTDLFSQPGVKNDPQIRETGALRISNNSWESSYHLTFDESTWSKPLINFQPDQLSAPRDLLPRSTVLYYFMKVDAVEALREWSKVATAEEKKGLSDAWAIDFNKEVLPEFDLECGAAMLGLPDLNAKDWSAPWVVFFKLKSDRLQHALEEGHLFKDVGGTNVVTKIKFGSSELYVAVKNGFLVASDTQSSLELLDRKEKLVASPDFAKAVKRTPTGIGAFGGYNLEATAAHGDAGSDSVKAQTANLILSLARAFHSPSLYATINSGSIDARSSISMDREGRYSVAELQSLAANSEPTFAVLEPSGIPIANQERIKSLRLRIHTKAAGEVERIAEDLSSSFQNIEKRSEQELQLQVLPRRAEPKQRIELPITASEFAPFLTSTKEIRSDEKTVSDKAHEIAGADRDAWSVARKLADWTYKNLTWKRVDYADAVQTLATREADCYEFSKLYVAMARSLGLPARVVSGMAYSGGAFGGHAWAEVYAGSWIEIDPTWGTSFVDATHIKDSNGALLTYAALNLVQLEVLEAPRGVAEFQLNPSALVKKLCEELPDGGSEALKTALDVATVTDELMGPGTWSAMTDKEHDQISGPYRRVVSDISLWLKKEESYSGGLRLLKVNVNGDRAEALVMHSPAFREVLLKLILVRRGDAWLLVEIAQADTGLKLVSESLQPAIKEILARRKGENGNKPGATAQTDFARVLITMDKDPKAALELAEVLLKDNPKDRDLRFLKSLAFVKTEKKDEAVKLWTELSDEQPPLAAALLNLAEHYETSKEESDKKKAIDLYVRYIALEPDDPRARRGLANLYEGARDFARGELEYRAAVERDSSNSLVFLDLAEFYAARKRFNDAVAVVDEAAKRTEDKDDLFADLISRFWYEDQTDVPEGLAASQPQRMAQSAQANLNLARVRLDHDHPREALPLLKKAAALDRKSPDPYDLMAEVYRKLHEWAAALNAADTAIRLSNEDSEAHYERACALARLGRRNEALAALKRAIELSDDLANSLEDEEDLKPLATLAEFKKLLPKREKP
jgi:tetratricopeptide (TPR) repeat protein